MGNQWKDKYGAILIPTITDHLSNSIGIQEMIQIYKLTENECAAITYYTADMRPFGGVRDESPFKALNSVLVTRDMNLIDPWKPYIYYLLSGLNKLPPVQKKVYRAIDKSLSELSTSYRVNGKVCWIGFTSTSLDRNIIDTFIGKSKGTYMEINVIEGKDISMFSIFPEKEVLLLPNSTFNVDQVLSDSLKSLMKMPLTTDGMILSQLPTPPHLILMKQKKENINDLKQTINEYEKRKVQQDMMIKELQQKIVVQEKTIIELNEKFVMQEQKIKDLQKNQKNNTLQKEKPDKGNAHQDTGNVPQETINDKQMINEQKGDKLVKQEPINTWVVQTARNEKKGGWRTRFQMSKLPKRI